eukprot:Opistho-2@25032
MRERPIAIRISRCDDENAPSNCCASNTASAVRRASRRLRWGSPETTTDNDASELARVSGMRAGSAERKRRNFPFGGTDIHVCTRRSRDATKCGATCTASTSTDSPFAEHDSMIASASSMRPSPREMRVGVRPPFSDVTSGAQSASLGHKMTTGVAASPPPGSAGTPGRATKSGPMRRATSAVSDATRRSGRRHLMTSVRWRGVTCGASVSSASTGVGFSSGFAQRRQSRQAAGLSRIDLRRALCFGTDVARTYRSAHASLVSQSQKSFGIGGTTSSVGAFGPLRRRGTSALYAADCAGVASLPHTQAR